MKAWPRTRTPLLPPRPEFPWRLPRLAASDVSWQDDFTLIMLMVWDVFIRRADLHSSQPESWRLVVLSTNTTLFALSRPDRWSLSRKNDTGSLRLPPSRSGTFTATSLMVALYRTYARSCNARSFSEAVAHLVALSCAVVPDSASKVTWVLMAIRIASWSSSGRVFS